MSPFTQFGLVAAGFFLLSGSLSALSSQYITQASCNCFSLFKQADCSALLLAFDNAGKSIAARIAMMAITTSSSISVNPVCVFIFTGFFRMTFNLKFLLNYKKRPAFQQGVFVFNSKAV